MKMAQVGEVAEQIRGVSYAKGDAADQSQDGYVPLLRGGNITETGLSLEDLIFVPASKVSVKQQLQKGDVVIAASSGSLASVGKAASVPADLLGTFGAFCKVLRPSSLVDDRYFHHFFQTKNYRATVSSLAAGANINNLRNEHLDEMRIPLPPLEEQRRIADILDKADELRTKRREALAHLDTLTQSIFYEMFGHPIINPMQWPVGRVSDLLESAKYGTSSKASAQGEFPVLRMNNISYSGQLVLDDLKYMDLAESEYDKYLVRTGDVLFNRTNSAELVGKTALVRIDTPMAFAGYLVRLRANPSTAPEYLAAFMNLPQTKQTLRNMCKSIVGMANINAKEVQTIRIPVPPRWLQDQFAGRVAAVERLKEHLRTQLAELDTLFASLQHRAFKGEL